MKIESIIFFVKLIAEALLVFCLTLIHKFDHQLFRSVQYPHHCLHHLLPEIRTIKYPWQLRPRGHDYTLCHIHSTTFKKAFLNRCLFASI